MTRIINELHLVQMFSDVWRTIYASTYDVDAADIFRQAGSMTGQPLRLVIVTHNDLDFLTHHARDFKVIESQGRLDPA